MADYQISGGQDPYGNGRPPLPKTYLALSIIVTLICCLPFGLIGIINASRVESRYNAGNYDGALKASRNAKRWSLAGILFYVIVFILLFILLMFGAIDANSLQDFEF